jgi:hypothetical protein
MRSRLFAVSGLVALLVTMVPVIVRAQSDTTTPAPTPAPTVKQGRHHKEKHPELMKAMRALERAKGDLAHANRDFDGHRAKAAELTEAAIKEIQEAIQSDKS